MNETVKKIQDDVGRLLAEATREFDEAADTILVIRAREKMTTCEKVMEIIEKHA